MSDTVESGKSDLLHKQELHSSDGAASIMANGILSEGLYNLLVDFCHERKCNQIESKQPSQCILPTTTPWSSEKPLPDMRLLTKQS